MHEREVRFKGHNLLVHYEIETDYNDREEEFSVATVEDYVAYDKSGNPYDLELSSDELEDLEFFLGELYDDDLESEKGNDDDF